MWHNYPNKKEASFRLCLHQESGFDLLLETREQQGLFFSINLLDENKQTVNFDVAYSTKIYFLFPEDTAKQNETGG